jgi:hypothetical protein
MRGPANLVRDRGFLRSLRKYNCSNDDIDGGHDDDSIESVVQGVRRVNTLNIPPGVAPGQSACSHKPHIHSSRGLRRSQREHRQADVNHDKHGVLPPAGPVRLGANRRLAIQEEDHECDVDEDQRPVVEEQEDAGERDSEIDVLGECDDDVVGNRGKRPDDGEGDGGEKGEEGHAVATHRDDGDDAVDELQDEKERGDAGHGQRRLFVARSGIEVLPR